MGSRTPPGSYVHFELYSSDPAKTRSFYEDLFGWTFERIPSMGYTTAMPPSPPDGGLMDRRGVDMPVPEILCYLYSGDLDATMDELVALGAVRVGEPIVVPEVGRFSVFEAPGGIVQALWEDAPEYNEAEERIPPEDPRPGSIVHVGLRSRDVAATRAFFAEAFGWTFETFPDAGYETFQAPRPPHGGLMELDPATSVPPTVVYLGVVDLDASLEAVLDHGGKVLEGPDGTGEFGRGAVVQVPGGIVQGLWEPSLA